ncbi:MAG: hypothetical protein QM687_17410 [Ferruginibacter sp.]
MKFVLSVLSSLLLCIAACNDAAKKGSGPAAADSVSVTADLPSATTACFAQQNLNDSIELSLKIEGNKASGSLNYLFKDKDSNRGTIEGTMKGDTLIADYTFNSEGVSSVRQVAFLVQADKATEGYADLEQKDGKLIFKDIAAISFSKGLVLPKQNCK